MSDAEWWVYAHPYEHRKQGIVERLQLLGEVFCIDVCAYAVMANDHHLVVRPNRFGARTDGCPRAYPSGAIASSARSSGLQALSDRVFPIQWLRPAAGRQAGLSRLGCPLFLGPKVGDVSCAWFTGKSAGAGGEW